MTAIYRLQKEVQEKQSWELKKKIVPGGWVMSSNCEKTEISHFIEAIGEILCFPMMLRWSLFSFFLFYFFFLQRARDEAIRHREQGRPPSASKMSYGEAKPQNVLWLANPRKQQKGLC